MLEAPEQQDSPAEQLEQRPSRFTWLRTLQATATRRVLFLTALGGLLIAGAVTALPIGGDESGRLGSYVGFAPVPSTGAKGNEAFNEAKRGDCLTWPEKTPEPATVVDCAGEHRFEVAESVDMRTFPGSEYGPDAAPPSSTRIQQISREQCETAVRRYLGPHFDPNSKFTIGMLWSGDNAWRQSGERRMLCGLELPGADNQQIAFKGNVAALDQSKVWPAGTCLGIDPASNQPNDIPVDCAAPHAMEVTGTVNLAEKFPAAMPTAADQDAFIKDVCTRETNADLAPVQLRNTTLTLSYNTVSMPSWSAGSRQVACFIGSTLGNGGWATLLNSAKGPLLINGRPPIPPPGIPEERLDLAPIPMPANGGSAGGSGSPPMPANGGSAGGSGSPTGQSQGNQHLPQQPAAPVAPPAAAPPAAAPPPPGAEAPPSPPAPELPPPPPEAAPPGEPPAPVA